MMNRFTRFFFKAFFLSFAVFLISGTLAYSANVSVSWTPNNPEPEGYRVFLRQEGLRYNYKKPAWEDNRATCTLTGLEEGITYYFVVRAFDGNLESTDSVEVSYTPKSSQADSDHDNIPDALDRFPNNPNEWADNDGDGIGNNQDPDDDNDGMDDDWERANGLNPNEDDADLDADNDGVSNLDEFTADTEPVSNPDNLSPDAPTIDDVQQTERVCLTPVLIAANYFDEDHDAHKQTQWQISTEADFSELILNVSSGTRLTALTVGEMVLDVDTQYYWRVKFIDSRHGTSKWSETATFTTIDAEISEDTDANGMPDDQEVDASVDVNGDGTNDLLEDDIMSVHAVSGQTVVGVEVLSDNASLVSVKSVGTDHIKDKSIKTAFGLIGFKLYLQEEGQTATVRIHFSKKVDALSKMYKHQIDEGWRIYNNAVLSEDGKSFTMVLEDGGIGDEDGVKNGIIVDPSGIFDPESANTGSAAISSGGGGGGCFISAGCQRFDAPVAMFPKALVLLTLLVGAAVGLLVLRTSVRIKYQPTL